MSALDRQSDGVLHALADAQERINGAIIALDAAAVICERDGMDVFGERLAAWATILPNAEREVKGALGQVKAGRAGVGSRAGADR